MYIEKARKLLLQKCWRNLGARMKALGMKPRIVSHRFRDFQVN